MAIKLISLRTTDYGIRYIIGYTVVSIIKAAEEEKKREMEKEEKNLNIIIARIKVLLCIVLPW